MICTSFSRASVLAGLVLFFYSSAFAGTPSYLLKVSQTEYTPLQGATPLSMEWWDKPKLKSNPHFPIDIGTETFRFFGGPFDLNANNRIGISPNGELKMANEQYYLIIYAFFTGLDSTRATQVSYKMEGTPGERIVKIEWSDVGFLECPATAFVNFQLWLYQKTGVFEIRYGPRNIAVDCKDIFWTNSGPFVAIFRGIQHSPYVDGNFFLFGDPDSPSIEYNDFPPLTGAPKENTLYTFTPTAPTYIADDVVSSMYPPIRPNPVGNDLRYSLPDVSDVIGIRILDITGRVLWEKVSMPSTGEIAVENLQAGTYLLEFHTQKEIIVRKFVKL